MYMYLHSWTTQKMTTFDLNHFFLHLVFNFFNMYLFKKRNKKLSYTSSKMSHWILPFRESEGSEIDIRCLLMLEYQILLLYLHILTGITMVDSDANNIPPSIAVKLSRILQKSSWNWLKFKNYNVWWCTTR